ncbi:MAG: restriction endonuclease [Thermoplasmata archaeon]|nr:restriction endonuclease [Thermoplasmata archaeon]
MAYPMIKKSSDRGIDGFTSDGIPVQVKQSERVGRNVVDNFETALRRYYQDSDKKNLKGIIVAFSFTTGAYKEAKRAKLEDNIEIELLTVEELF